MRMLPRVPLVLSLALIAALGTACKKAEKAAEPAKSGSGKGTGTGTGAAKTPKADPEVEKAAPDAAVVADAVLAHPFFYAVASPKGKTVHILGTVHLGVDPSRLPPLVWDTLAKSKTFAMETNIMDPALLGAVMRDDGSTLDQELGAEYWKKLQDAIGADMAEGVKNMKASVVATLVAIRGLPMTQPMDLALMQKAKDGGARIVFLEPASSQQALLEKWLDARTLKMMLDDLAGGEAKNKQMLAEYVAGDGDAVEEITFDREEWKKTGRPDSEFDEMNAEMLYDRNAAWIPAIEKMLAEGDAFIAVGAAHLLGDRSVLDLLEKKGHKVTRLEP